jgi:hypothetical protein
MTPAERCRAEIAEVEAQLLAGHSDVQGLCLAYSASQEATRFQWYTLRDS